MLCCTTQKSTVVVRYRVVENFQNDRPGDLTIAIGDILEIRDANINKNWWYAKNRTTKKKGYVPKNFLSLMTDEPENTPGFFDITKQEAYLKLMLPKVDYGVYLIRPSSDGSNSCISLKFKNDSGQPNVIHYKIFRSKNQAYYIFPEKIFNTLNSLLNFYRENKGLKTYLKSAYNTIYYIPPLDKYVITRDQLDIGMQIGSGAFGEVFLATWCKNLKVAVKIMRNEFLGDNIFEKEIDIIQKLQHPYILQLLGVCVERDNILMVTEYIQNGNIKTFLKESVSSELTENHLIQILYQIAQGMKYLISRNVVHRDLRAENILITKDFNIKIADFGLARMVPDAIYMANSKSIRFPIKWAAPEIFRKTCIFNEKTDIWSYGITIYEILSRGKEPYESIPIEEIQHLVVSRNILVFPNGFQCHNYMRQLMISCWIFEPNERPSFSQIVQGLKDYFYGENI